MSTDVCRKCNKFITDKVIVVINDDIWHEDCTRCHKCHCPLTNQCYELDDELLCLEDYLRLKFRLCERCEGPIFPDDMVLYSLPTRVFHRNCFLCNICNKLLVPGDRYFILSSGSILVCQLDYDDMKKNLNTERSSYSKNIQGSDESSKESCKAGSSRLFMRSPGNIRSDPTSVCFDEELNSEIDQSYDEVMSSDNEDKSCVIRRRTPRTTIKASQLDSLKSTFAITPKPSRQMREQLAQCTGLSMRVIQVWFQNRRSKERRSKLSGQRKVEKFRYTTHGEVDRHDNINHVPSIRQDIEPHDSNLQMHLNSGSFNSRSFAKVANETVNEARYSSNWFVNRSLGLFNKIV